MFSDLDSPIHASVANTLKQHLVDSTVCRRRMEGVGSRIEAFGRKTEGFGRRIEDYRRRIEVF